MSLAADLFSAKGLVVVVTGGGSGIGLNAVRAFDANGAKAVYVIGRREEPLRKAAAASKNGSIIPLVGDVSSKEDLERMASQVRAEHGYINALFCNAGIVGPTVFDKLPKDRAPTVEEFKQAAWDLSMEDFNHTFAVNVSAPFYTTLAFLELLNEGNKRGDVYQKSQVIVTASIGGFNRVPQNGWAYQPSKAGAVHLVKMMSTYFAPWKIRANCLAPGLYLSEMTDGVFSFMKEGDRKPITEEGSVPEKIIPLARSGTEDDIAGALLFMISKAGSYLNGTTIVSDGGRLGQVPSAY